MEEKKYRTNNTFRNRQSLIQTLETAIKTNRNKRNVMFIYAITTILNAYE